jgi:hypothetical protein
MVITDCNRKRSRKARWITSKPSNQVEGGGQPQDGINTKLMRKVDGHWVIALNHVSSREMAR